MRTVGHHPNKECSDGIQAGSEFPRGALADAFDDATIMIGGFGRAGAPIELLEQLNAQGVSQWRGCGQFVQSFARGLDVVRTFNAERLGLSYLSALSLPEVAQPHLASLSRMTNESTSASVLAAPDIVYIARVSARRIMAARVSVGTRFPAYVTAMGRVLLVSAQESRIGSCSTSSCRLSCSEPPKKRSPIAAARRQEVRLNLYRQAG
jgi:hypothetical protein